MTESISDLLPPGEEPGSTSLPRNSHNHTSNHEEPPSYEMLDDSTQDPPPYSPSFATNAANRIFDIPEAPPDYFSVVSSRIQEARRESDDCCGFCQKAFRTIAFLVALTLVLIVIISIPVAMLAIGAGYIGECPIEPMIPIYLVLAGICGIVKSIEAVVKQFMVSARCSCFRSCLQRWKKHPKLKYLLLVWRILDLIFNLVLLGLFIAGSYWIFHVYQDLRKRDYPSDECDPVLYKISFGIMICTYIIFVSTCSCVCGCALCRNRTSDEQVPHPPRLRRTADQEELNRNEEGGGDLGNVLQLDEFYQEPSEINDELASVDLSAGSNSS